jgi:hypothetical protein
LAGAYAAEKILGPVFSNLAKPFAENAVDSEAAKAAVDYLANAVRGEFVMNQAVRGLFQTAEIIPKSLMPTEASRTKLQTALDQMHSPQVAMNVGAGLAHYMPDHSTTAAAVAAQASSYLNSIRPRSQPASPFDALPPLDKAQTARYDRALDIAQQPLMVLQFAKEGTLTPQDVKTIRSVYPGFHSAVVSKINNELIARHAAGERVPYSQRIALSQLTGAPLDATMIPQRMHGIMLSQSPAQPQQQGGPKKASNVELKQINKVNEQYATGPQARQIQTRSK